VLNLSVALRREGLEPIVLTRYHGARARQPSPRERIVQGIPVYEVSGVRDLLATFRSLRPSVVHLHGARCGLAARAGVVCRLLQLPYVVTPHCFYPPKCLLDLLRKAAFDRLVLMGVLGSARGVICMTEVDRRSAIARGALPDRIVQVPNSVDLNDLLEGPGEEAPNGWSHDCRYVLSVGRLDPIKRFDLLIHAFSDGAPVESRLAIAGPDGGEGQRLRALVAELGLKERVLLTGSVSDRQIRWMYRHCALFVLASAFEGLPTVVLEAMALGAPVLASDAGGTSYLIRNHLNGYLFRNGDRRDLAECLQVLLRVRPPGDVIERARREIAERYSWQVNCKRVSGLYRRCASGSAVV
jgi:glycosyltransferase involved in cell wall biosynthesis